MSDAALSQTIGSFVKHHRIQQNKTQHDLAQLAGISRSTLSLLERGESVTLMTVLQVLRVLNKLNVLESFLVTSQVSPLQLAKEQKKQRYRVRKPNAKNSPKPDSTW